MAKTLEKSLNKIRKGIPEKYNQLEYLDYLDDDDTDIIMSITTRTDGKTFNTLRALLMLSIDLDFSTLIITHHAELEIAMLTQIQDVIDTDPKLDYEKFNFYNNMDYTTVDYDGKTAFIICNLNNAGDLKNYSAVLRKCNLTLFDEFLVLPDDYVPYEYKKYKMIFETMDRDIIDPMQHTNKRRKSIFLANPINFDSEFLAIYDLYEQLANQPINTIQKYKNIVIERRQNLNAQENKNNRMFPDSETNESVTGMFNINMWGIKSINKSEFKPIIIKTADKYIKVYTDLDTPIIDVTAITSTEEYQYNTELVDNSDESVYTDEKFKSDKMYKAYNKGLIKFSNVYSKNYVLTNYVGLNIKKIIRLNKRTLDDRVNTSPAEIDEMIEYQNLRNNKRRIMMQMLE